MRMEQFLSELRKRSKEYFKSKSYTTGKYDYILEKHDDWEKNIILPVVREYLKKTKQESAKKTRFSLHTSLHNGLSSQACLFNLIGPFVVAEKQYDVLKQIINLTTNIKIEGKIQEAKFEYTDPNTFQEHQRQPTSIDLYIATNKDRIFLEFKLKEAGFGTCSIYNQGNCDGMNPKPNLELCYLHGRHRGYFELMEKYGLLKDTESCPFVEFYQAYRLLLFSLEHKGKFLFVYDERNPAFLCEIDGRKRGKFQRFYNLLPDDIKSNVGVLTIQQIEDYIEEQVKPEWIKEFRKRYG